MSSEPRASARGVCLSEPRASARGVCLSEPRASARGGRLSEPRASARGGRLIHRHGGPLFADHILDGCSDRIPRPQIPRAGVTRPTAPAWKVQCVFVQGTAAIGLHAAHDLFWCAVGRHDDMKVVGANVGGQQGPTVPGADLPHAVQHHLPAKSVQLVGTLRHPVRCMSLLVRAWFWEGTAEPILTPRYTPVLAWQPSSVTSPCD